MGASRRQEFKVKAIREFMERFKQRRVVLVGDSGEQDPEVYARILSEFADRVVWVLSRDVSNDPQLAQKNRSVLFATPERSVKLRVFSDPRELFSLPLAGARPVPRRRRRPGNRIPGRSGCGQVRARSKLESNGALPVTLERIDWRLLLKTRLLDGRSVRHYHVHAHVCSIFGEPIED